MDFLKWKNEKTKGWIDKNIAYENWQMNEDSIMVDQKYIEPITNIMQRKGYGKSDFEVINR